MNKNTSAKFIECSSVEEVMHFVDNKIEEKGVNDVIARQVRLLAEEVMNYVVEELNPNRVSVSFVTSFGQSAIRITVKGDVSFNINDYEGENISLRILKNNLGRLRVRNGNGRTTISILFKESMEKTVRRSVIALVSAFAIGLLLSLISPSQATFIDDQIIWPAALIVLKTIQLIAAPLTLLCLTINVANIVNISERFPYIRRLELKYLGSSFYAAAIGIVVALIITPFFRNVVDPSVVGSSNTNALKLSHAWEAITSMVPGNVLEPISGSGAATLCFTGVLFGIAVGLVDRESGKIKDFLEMIKMVFCKILTIVVHLTPAIIFIIVLDIVIDLGPETMIYELILILVMLLAVAVLMLVYALQLRISGLSPSGFLKEYSVCFLDVLKLGSSVDAVPNTIKYCNKRMPHSRDLIEVSIPLGAETNMDGVTLIATCLLLILATISNISLTPYQIVLMALLIIFVAIGAPNQPGTLTIVATVVMPMIGLDYACLATVVLIELILNRVLATIDTVGDVVSTRIESERMYKK